MKFISKRIFFDTFFNAYLFSLLYFLLLYYVGPDYVGPEWDKNQKFLGSTLLSYFFIFVTMGFVSALLLSLVSINSLGSLLFEPYKNYAQQGVKKAFWRYSLYLCVFGTLIASLVMTQASFTDLIDKDGLSGAIRLFSGIFNPNFDILPKAILAIIETIYIAFLATFIALPFAFLLSFFSAKNIMTHSAAFSVYVLLRTFLNTIRSVEPLIWAIIFSVWVGIGPFAGMLALMLHSVASLTKQYSEIVECISEGPVEGIRATGASTLQTVLFGVIPQIILPYISFTIYRWDINVRMATVIGLVGGGGIGTMLIQYQGQALWQEVGCIVIVIAVVVWILDTSSAYIREAIK